MTAAIRIPRFIAEMVHHGRVGAGKAGYSFDPQIFTDYTETSAGGRSKTGQAGRGQGRIQELARA